MLLNRVLKFFITVFAVIIGATLLEFASPVLAYIISAEFLQINLDILDMTMMNALSISSVVLLVVLLDLFLLLIV